MADQELARVREGLESSPYSLPDDDENLSLLAEMLPRAAALEDRCRAIREALAKEFTDRLNRASRTTEIYESNAIEGKTATLRETYEILQRRAMWDADAALARYTLHSAIADEPKVQDVVGLAAARILVDQYIADRYRPLNEADIRDMHSLLLRGDPSAGRYKQYLNKIEGSTHTPIPPVDVPGAMQQLTAWLRDSTAPLLWKSAVVHAWLTHIHPFDDGNGRIARLLANFVLGFGCYPPLIVKSTADRPRYLAALGHSDAAGDVAPLVRLFVRVLNRGITFMERPEFAWDLFQADLKVREDSVYRRWQSTRRRFFDEVSAHLLTAGVVTKPLGRLSASDYELLRRRDKSGNTWFMSARLRDASRSLLVWIGFPSSSVYGQLEADQVFPAFFLSENDPNPKAIKPYRPGVLGQDPLHDELCLVADEDRAILRRGKVLRRLRLPDAAELFAAIIAGYLGRMGGLD